MIRRIKERYTFWKYKREEKKKWIAWAKACDISPDVIKFIDFKKR